MTAAAAAAVAAVVDVVVALAVVAFVGRQAVEAVAVGLDAAEQVAEVFELGRSKLFPGSREEVQLWFVEY